jgi:hypothetical protein
MARRPAADTPVTMFPFLSVLCSMIGVLMLFLIVILSGRAVGGPGPDVDDHGRPITIDAETFHAHSAELEKLIAQLQERRAECDRLRGLCTELRGLIQSQEEDAAWRRKTGGPVRTAAPLGAKEQVSFVPDRAGDSRPWKEPILVEVRADGFLVHPELTHYDAAGLTAEDSEAPLAKFLQSVDAARDRQQLVLLVHPNGVRNYRKLRDYLLEKFGTTVKVPGWPDPVPTSRIDVGVEPCPEQWSVVDVPAAKPSVLQPP